MDNATENTGKPRYTHELRDTGTHAVFFSHGDEVTELEILDALNSYSTLKAENVMLLATIRSLNDETDEAEKQINNLKADNEAKEKLLKKFEYAKYGILTLCTRMQENPDEKSHLETIKKILLDI